MYRLPFSTNLQILAFIFLLSYFSKIICTDTPHEVDTVTVTAIGDACPSPETAPPPLADLNLSHFIDIKIYLAYQIIQRFKSTITSDPLSITQTWVGPDVCNSYKGFYCDSPPNNKSATALAAIDFNGYLLGAPSITEFLAQLPDLAFFHANSNKFRGTITAEAIANLPFLYELDVSNNLLTGPFPVAVLRISRITFLDIRFNAFSGAVPAQLFSLKLEVLFLNDNGFKQPLPGNLWESPVNYLTLANNQFTGGIPCFVGKASETLIEVLLLNNQLAGCLPYQVGLLRNATVFDVSYNQLTGPIPPSWGCMGKVEQLNLAGNYLYGKIPAPVCQIGSLLNLSLSDNYFTSIGPACIHLIKTGVLDDRKNCILGRPMQRSPAECIAFFLKNKYYCPLGPSHYYLPCEHTLPSYFPFHRPWPWPPWRSSSSSYSALKRQNP